MTNAGAYSAHIMVTDPWEKLVAICQVQNRIDAVARDIQGKRYQYADIPTWDLGQALGLEWRETADPPWSRLWLINRFSVDEVFEFPLAENIDLLEGCLEDDKRFEFLSKRADKILAEGKGPDLIVTKEEREIILGGAEDRLEEGKYDCADFILAECALSSTHGFQLNFQVCTGDGGDPFDVKGPYEFEKGEFKDADDYILFADQ